MTLVLGPMPCLNCKQPVWWDRVGPDLRLMETRHGRHRSHGCPPTCLVMLPNVKEPCARRRGHSGSHRSRYALDNAKRARRKFGWAAAA